MDDTLMLEQWIMSTDEDQPIVEDVVVGYDDKLNLVVRLICTDYEEEGCNSSVSAIVNKDGAFKLAKRLSLKMTELPARIAECFEEYGEIVNSSFSDASRCFCEIIEAFVDEKCRYSIRHQRDKYGLSPLN